MQTFYSLSLDTVTLFLIVSITHPFLLAIFKVFSTKYLLSWAFMTQIYIILLVFKFILRVIDFKIEVFFNLLIISWHLILRFEFVSKKFFFLTFFILTFLSVIFLSCFGHYSLIQGVLITFRTLRLVWHFFSDFIDRLFAVCWFKYWCC